MLPDDVFIRFSTRFELSSISIAVKKIHGFPRGVFRPVSAMTVRPQIFPTRVMSDLRELSTDDTKGSTTTTRYQWNSQYGWYNFAKKSLWWNKVNVIPSTNSLINQSKLKRIVATRCLVAQFFSDGPADICVQEPFYKISKNDCGQVSKEHLIVLV